jgi:hypothetical protein
MADLRDYCDDENCGRCYRVAPVEQPRVPEPPTVKRCVWCDLPEAEREGQPLCPAPDGDGHSFGEFPVRAATTAVEPELTLATEERCNWSVAPDAILGSMPQPDCADSYPKEMPSPSEPDAEC